MVCLCKQVIVKIPDGASARGSAIIMSHPSSSCKGFNPSRSTESVEASISFAPSLMASSLSSLGVHEALTGAHV